IPSSVLLVDQGLRVVSANRNFLEKNQRPLSDTIGQRLERVFPDVIIEHTDLVRSTRGVLSGDQPIRGRRMTYRAPGVPIRIYYYSILPFMWHGTAEGALILMEDITEQVRLSEEVRRVERQLASVVESVSEIVISTDTAGRVQTWNNSAEQLTGFLYPEIEKRPLVSFFAAGDQAEIGEIINRIDLRDKKAREREYPIKTRDGVYLQLHWVFSPMKDHLNQTVGIVAVGRDLTERMKFEAELMQSQKLAALGVMAGGIAHEIRNPLAICSSAAQFLMDENISPKLSRECAERVRVGIDRASAIIENLLKFAHPQSDKMNLVNMASLLKETVSLIGHHALVHKIAVELVLPDEPLVVDGVATLLQQVFMNLLLNAVSAMPDGGLLKVEGRASQGEVIITVSDTGCGIPQSNMERIFDPFFTTSPVGKGAGLGLSICYSIVKKHNGTIEVESRQGKQTVFTIRLPER
ncbi:MAG: ATP-binding protein, partial [Myxococcota bacterium]